MNAGPSLSPHRYRPDVVVATVVPRDDGRFLFVEERVRGKLVVNQPAGHLEPGESLVEAAVRETREESGWQVRIEALLAIYQWVEREGAHCMRFTLAATPERNLETPLDRGIVRTLWLNREELLGGGFTLRTPLVLKSLDDFATGRRLPLEALPVVHREAAER